ncbi:putative F-box protein [Raphanus sativus]|uniref:F-box protein At2g04810 n=1 Tax=Raphanus sativus TaxID=3726 RepID=A0A9W3DH26_RAPSA|nr:putative F-box protein At2g04810 [Raphanus sativus]KAJ4901186.1 putative F-box protein [Raphanus sativus]
MDTHKELMRKMNKRGNASRTRDWSKLCPDVLRKILETLNPLASNRAKTVCSDWYSVWKTCLRPPCNSLHIIHQGDSSRLFDPEEDKICTRKLVGRSNRRYCMASFENWLLMVDSRLEFHIFNLLTCKRINLPSMSSHLDGWGIIFDNDDDLECSDLCGYLVEPCGKKIYVSKDVLEWQSSAVLWINEKTGDYFVAWTFRHAYLFSYKKGDEMWLNLSNSRKGSRFLDMAYRNSKLYLLTTDHRINVFYLSRDCNDNNENPNLNQRFQFDEQQWNNSLKKKIAIQESGEVLIILSLKGKIMFYVFKMNFESSNWERVESIGDHEMLIFGHGVTVKAPVEDVGYGVKSGSICFVDDDVWPDHDHRGSNCGVFNIATSEIEWHRKPCFYINESQWFVPWFA